MGHLNRLQRQNQHLIKRALRQPVVFTSLRVDSRRVVHVHTASWHEYWDGCDALPPGLTRLHASWKQYVEHRYSAAYRERYVHAYFSLLHDCLDAYRRDHIAAYLLGKVIGFETFGISGDQGQPVAGAFNVGNPAYLLSRIARLRAAENPKFLPLICLSGELREGSGLFRHYRRIGIMDSYRAELFVHSPAEPRACSLAYRLIGELFASLTPKSDPWSNERSRSLFEGAFGHVIAPFAKRHLRLLDVACGSARVTTSLCRRASSEYGSSFDLTLVDVVRAARSMASTFIRRPKTFGNVILHHENLFDWIDRASSEGLPQFDVVLMLRVCDLFSDIRIEGLPWDEVATLLYRDRGASDLGRNVSRPARLLEENRPDQIQHGLCRSSCRGGEVFHQFSLSDFFQAIQLLLTHEVLNDETVVYSPIRRIDESALVLASGDSLIEKLLTLGTPLIVEDSQLSPQCLRRHAESPSRFGLGVALFDDQFRRLTLEFLTVPLLLRHNEHVPFEGNIACVFHTPRVHRR